MKLSDLRKKIDNIDEQIIELLNKRASIAKGVGKLKHKTGKGVYVPDRETEIYMNILKKNKGPLSVSALKAIYREVMSSSLALEKSLKIAYLGPEATFTHLASKKKFGSQVQYSSCNTITEVFREVEVGRSDYGVVPVENSIEGAVSHTLDMFIGSDLKICSEIYLEIEHNLIGRCSLKDIKRVYSNPQVFGQCRIWLDSNLPKVELIEVSTTSKAAEIASREKHSSAIASSLAAERYRLKILAKDIEDKANNITRFLVIGQHITAPTKKNKTSIIFSGKDKIGALHDMLAPFKKNKVNLAKIESRPSKRKAWEYYFFVDMLGHYQDPHVKKALNELGKKSTLLKVLGSYPVAM
ncbi:MAG: prephenate dehydratase [Candidatus Omnitrophica bacterium]|nr:prephenate dehydratase [Candidatus Omnitrophota bacterium]MBU1853347.1 prephenate dehydratase [Candidatus Omnitrophota bacterium]